MLSGIEAAVPVAREESEDIDGVDASSRQRHRIAVGGEQPVVGVQAHCRRDLAGFLPPTTKKKIASSPSVAQPARVRCRCNCSGPTVMAPSR